METKIRKYASPLELSNESKLTILILLWVLDKAFMVLLFWAIK